MNDEQKPLRTAKATAARVRKTDEKAAARLRGHGWQVTPPEERTDTNAISDK